MLFPLFYCARECVCVCVCSRFSICVLQNNVTFERKLGSCCDPDYSEWPSGMLKLTENLLHNVMFNPCAGFANVHSAQYVLFCNQWCISILIYLSFMLNREHYWIGLMLFCWIIAVWVWVCVCVCCAMPIKIKTIDFYCFYPNQHNKGNFEFHIPHVYTSKGISKIMILSFTCIPFYHAPRLFDWHSCF